MLYVNLYYVYGACDVVQYMYCHYIHVPYSRKFGGEKVWRIRIYSFRALATKVWQINRSTKRLLIASTNLDGSSLANHGKFAKVSKFSPHQTFPLYSI